MPASRRSKANGITLRYLEWGPPDGPPVVLLHGLRGHAHAWDDVSSALADRYRVLAIDQRGRGESDWAPDGNYATEAFVADLAALCDALALGPFILIGHSMGGRNGILFTAKHRERVAAFVIADVGPEIQAEGAARIRKELIDAPEEFESLEAAVAQAVAENPLAAESVLRRRVVHQTRPLPAGRIGWRYDPVIREQVRSNARAVPPDFWALWRTIECPALIVRGGQTDVLSRPVAERMRESIARAQLVEIPRAGHMVFEDNPREFVHAIRGWMDALPPVTPPSPRRA